MSDYTRAPIGHPQNRDITSPEHRLQLGSYIFTTSMKHNGSQSRERAYFIFKVTEIVSVVEELAVLF